MKHFLSFDGLDRQALLDLLVVANKLKVMLKTGQEHKFLADKTLGMIFEKPSNRTRISFEVGMYQLGGKAIYIHGSEIGLGVRESIADIAKVLSRFLSAIMIRANAHKDIEELAHNAEIPVINGLSDLAHPCQALADVMTIQACKPNLTEVTLCYVGDGNNVCCSLIMIAQILGMKMRVACPPGYTPTGVCPQTFELFHDPAQAVQGADVIYTDVWTSMGQEAEREQRLRDFQGFCVTPELMSQAAPDAIFLHCLPAHRGEEVAAAVLDSPAAQVWEEAENRLHAQKAVLLKMLAPDVFRQLTE